MLPLEDPYVECWIREFFGQIISSRKERKRSVKEKALVAFLRMGSQYVRASELRKVLGYGDLSSFKNSTRFDDLELLFIFTKVPIRGHGFLYVKTEIAKELCNVIYFNHIIGEDIINICGFVNRIVSNKELNRKISIIGKLMQKYQDSTIIRLGLMLNDCTNICTEIDKVKINFRCSRFYMNRYTGCEIILELKNIKIRNSNLFICKLSTFILNFVKDIFLNDIYIDIFREHYKDKLKELKEEEFEKMVIKEFEKKVVKGYLTPQIRKQVENQFRNCENEDDLNTIRFDIIVKPWIPNFSQDGGD